MKRNISLVIIVILFNVVWLYGINYTNSLFLTPEKEVVVDKTEKVEILDFEGISYKEIGEKIDKHLEKSSLKGKGKYIAKSAISKGVDPYLIASIIIINTGCDRVCNFKTTNCKNVGDLVGGKVTCYDGRYTKYDKYEDSIDDLVNYIYNDFYSKEVKSPYDFYRSYGKTTNWAFKVNEKMEELRRS
mgnify:CR=1 FL=1